MSGAPQVSIVIVTWNSRAVVLDCLDALAANPPSVPDEVVVVDNASTDGTAAAVRAHAPAARLIVNRANRGLAAANNQGIAASRGAAILIANPDTVVRPGAIDALRAVLARRPRAAFAVPRLLDPGGAAQTSVGDLPTLREALLGRRALRRRAGADRGFWWDGWGHDEERRIGRGHEACYLVRRSAIDEIGPQDERFRLDWEGVDWAARAGAGGWQVWFTPAAEVVHRGGDSIRQVPLRWILGSHRGIYRYFAKRTPLALRPALAVAVALRGLVKGAAAAIGSASYERANRG